MVEVEYHSKKHEIKNTEDLTKYFKELEVDGRTALVFTRGDRKSRLTLKNIIWKRIDRADGAALILEEDIEDFDAANAIEIPIRAISKVKIFDEGVTDTEIDYYIVFYLNTGNELHIHTLVAA